MPLHALTIDLVSKSLEVVLADQLYELLPGSQYRIFTPVDTCSFKKRTCYGRLSANEQGVLLMRKVWILQMADRADSETFSKVKKPTVPDVSNCPFSQYSLRHEVDVGRAVNRKRKQKGQNILNEEEIVNTYNNKTKKIKTKDQVPTEEEGIHDTSSKEEIQTKDDQVLPVEEGIHDTSSKDKKSMQQLINDFAAQIGAEIVSSYFDSFDIKSILTEVKLMREEQLEHQLSVNPQLADIKDLLMQRIHLPASVSPSADGKPEVVMFGDVQVSKKSVRTILKSKELMQTKVTDIMNLVYPKTLHKYCLRKMKGEDRELLPKCVIITLMNAFNDYAKEKCKEPAKFKPLDKTEFTKKLKHTLYQAKVSHDKLQKHCKVEEDEEVEEEVGDFDDEEEEVEQDVI